MTKSTLSVLLAAMMAVSGFASAQTVDAKSGINGGAGPTGASGMGDNGVSVKSRAEVKAERNGVGAGVAPLGVSTGVQTQTNTTMGNRQPMAAPEASTMTGAEKRAANAERRAQRKAMRASKTDSSLGASSSASGAIGNSTVQGGGMGATGHTLGQGQPDTKKQGASAN